jgi:hypothetical protein
MKKNAKTALTLRAETIRSLRDTSLSLAAGGCFASLGCTTVCTDTMECPDGGMKPYPPGK